MSLMCMFGRHSWQNKAGHKCETCGQERSGSFAVYGCKCLRCGEIHGVPRNIWGDEETCQTCGNRLPTDIIADQWADALKVAKDYKALAAYLCSYHPYPETIHNPYSIDHKYERWMDLWNRKMHRARLILRAAGCEAVDAMISELDRGECKYDVVDILWEIGDPKAVPLLKKLLDRGVYDHDGTEGDRTKKIREFVEKYPQYHKAVEMVTCAICGKQKSATETTYCQGKQFCKGVCWNQRGRVVK